MISRVVTEDVTWRERSMRAGDSMVLCLGAAHRDPEVFVQSDMRGLDRL